METFKDATFDFVYASHVLEHLNEPRKAIGNWLRICKPQGFVIIYVPHRDLYEKRKVLPSRWNPDHKYFILPDKNEVPNTYSLIDLCRFDEAEIIRLEVCDYDFVSNGEEHSQGEYSILIILRRL